MSTKSGQPHARLTSGHDLGARHTYKHATTRLFLKRKNANSCRAILDATPINEMDPRPQTPEHPSFDCRR